MRKNSSTFSLSSVLRRVTRVPSCAVTAGPRIPATMTILAIRRRERDKNRWNVERTLAGKGRRIRAMRKRTIVRLRAERRTALANSLSSCLSFSQPPPQAVFYETNFFPHENSSSLETPQVQKLRSAAKMSSQDKTVVCRRSEVSVT